MVALKSTGCRVLGYWLVDLKIIFLGCGKPAAAEWVKGFADVSPTSQSYSAAMNGLRAVTLARGVAWAFVCKIRSMEDSCKFESCEYGDQSAGMFLAV
jgi:hypothetical protein